MPRNNNIYRVGYDSISNAKTGRHQYCFWDLGQCVVLESDRPFRKGDLVRLEEMDAARHTAVLSLAPPGSESSEALMFVAPKVPLDPSARYQHRSSACQVIHNRVVYSGGNMSIITLLAAPIRGRSSLTFIEEVSKNRFHYFIQG